jgi:hypothetical protein
MIGRFQRLALLSISMLLLVGGAARADVFQFACARLPFPAATQSRAIDRVCGIKGDPADEINLPKVLQNSLKNNLCASGEIVTLQLTDFVALQREVSARGIKFGHSGIPPHRQEFFPDDRTALSDLITVNGRALGEGAYVQFVAYMDHPHYMDSGESVNCHKSGHQMGDIHINLVQQPAPKSPSRNDPDHDQLIAERDRALCHAIVGEIIPHYRPALWEEKQLRAVADRQIPVRIAGQLFFDASHFPCNGEAPHPNESLRRASLWEIHPIYSIGVCRERTLQTCRADDGSAWIPLAEWRRTP